MKGKVSALGVCRKPLGGALGMGLCEGVSVGPRDGGPGLGWICRIVQSCGEGVGPLYGSKEQALAPSSP